MSKLILKSATFPAAVSPLTGYQDDCGRYVFNAQPVVFSELETIEKFTACVSNIYYNLDSDYYLVQIGYGVDVNGVIQNGGHWAVTITPWMQLACSATVDSEVLTNIGYGTPSQLVIVVAAYGIPKTS